MRLSELLGKELAGVLKTCHCPGHSAEKCGLAEGMNGMAPISMVQPTMVHVGTAIATTAITTANGNIILRM